MLAGRPPAQRQDRDVVAQRAVVAAHGVHEPVDERLRAGVDGPAQEVRDVRFFQADAVDLRVEDAVAVDDDRVTRAPLITSHARALGPQVQRKSPHPDHRLQSSYTARVSTP